VRDGCVSEDVRGDRGRFEYRGFLALTMWNPKRKGPVVETRMR